MIRIILLLNLMFSALFVFTESEVENIFSNDNKNQLFMNVEVALAEAQSELGIIPDWAAKEFRQKADIKYLEHKEVVKENSKVRHGLVARLNVWKRSLNNEASEFLHYGATTVDIMDTVLVLQIDNSLDYLIKDLLEVETHLLKLTKEHLNTYMAGRTLGQHALPITFGKKNRHLACRK